MIYLYRIERGLVTLSKMKDDGDEVGALKNVGTFKCDKTAKGAATLHHQKACKMAAAAGRVQPSIMFM